MTAAHTRKMIANAKLEDNAKMIIVYQHHGDGTVSRVHHTFRADSIVKFLRRKTGTFSVSQG